MQRQENTSKKLIVLLRTLSAAILGLVLPAISSYSIAGYARAQVSETCWSSTGKSYPCRTGSLAENLQTDSTHSLNGLCKVAIYFPENFGVGQDLANVLNTDPQIQAAVLSLPQIESGGLIGFDTLIARLGGFVPVTPLMAQAIKSFVAGGGGYIGEWWGAGAALSGVGISFDSNYFPPTAFLSLFAGKASDGNYIEFGHPITVTVSHPVTQGLQNVFSAGGGTEYFVRAIPPFDPHLTVLATYDGYGGTNPAVMVGASGSAIVVLLFFDAFDNPNDVNLKQLWINSVKYTCSKPFDVCIQDDSNGNILQFNSTTGEYQFTNCGGLIIGGTGTPIRRGSLITLRDSRGDRRVQAQIDGSVNKGTASIQIVSQSRTFTVIDRDTANNSCGCPTSSAK